MHWRTQRRGEIQDVGLIAPSVNKRLPQQYCKRFQRQEVKLRQIDRYAAVASPGHGRGAFFRKAAPNLGECVVDSHNVLFVKTKAIAAV